MIDERKLESELRRLLGVDHSWPVFVPVRIYEKNGRVVALHLMEGYVFVASGLDEVRYFRLERSKYVEKVLATQAPGGMRVLKVVSDREIQKLRLQLREQVSTYLSEGTKVLVTQGVYANLEGEVVDSLEDDPDNILVSFPFRSLERIARIPRAFVEIKEDVP